MKKIIMAAALFAGLLTSGFNAQACDKGCTMGGSYIGILPQFNQHFVGMRYTNRSYTQSATHTHEVNGQPFTHTDITNEHYNTLEAWARFYPTRRIQVLAFVPYVMNSQEKAGHIDRQHGLGDISLLANYSLINTGDSASHTIKHTLLLGGGVKLPTGEYKAQHGGEVLPANLQAGTGSVDYLFSAMYTIRYKQTGLSTDFTYRINGQGENDYRFGNRYNGAANIFYWHKVGKISLLPSAGIYYEKAQADSYHDHHKTQGGNGALFGNLGMSFYYNSLALNANYQVPLAQEELNHITDANSRCQLSVSWMF